MNSLGTIFISKIQDPRSKINLPSTLYALRSLSVLLLLLLTFLLFPPSASADFTTADLCERIADSSLRSECLSCTGRSQPTGKIWTSVGCLSTDTNELIPDIMRLAVSISGTVAISLLLIAAFTISTSTGNPERLKQGQEIGTASISGLIFILFSVILLNLIGVHLIHIPGF